jgi:hypothetical protein
VNTRRLRAVLSSAALLCLLAVAALVGVACGVGFNATPYGIFFGVVQAPSVLLGWWGAHGRRLAWAVLLVIWLTGWFLGGRALCSTVLDWLRVPADLRLTPSPVTWGGAAFTFTVTTGGCTLAAWVTSQLRELRRRALRQSGLCGTCGYDLRGSPGPRCPECGTAFQRVGGWVE